VHPCKTVLTLSTQQPLHTNNHHGRKYIYFLELTV
jgi:hypothetical protein